MRPSAVAVLKTHPQTVLADIERLLSLAGLEQALPKDKTTILKDNISWHFPYLSANTTPWQLEGTIQALRKAGYGPLVAVHNNTVVTNPYKGGMLNRLTPMYRRYGRERYNFRPADMRWIEYQLPACGCSTRYIRGHPHPEYFLGKNIVHLPTVKRISTRRPPRAMKNASAGS
jgi:hypothetical protein